MGPVQPLFVHWSLCLAHLTVASLPSVQVFLSPLSIMSTVPVASTGHTAASIDSAESAPALTAAAVAARAAAHVHAASAAPSDSPAASECGYITATDKQTTVTPPAADKLTTVAASASVSRFRNAYLRILLLGTHDPASPLRHLRGVTGTIFRFLIYPRLNELWQAHIVDGVQRGGDKEKQFFASRGNVKFPPPRDIDVNMMPFVLGDIDSLPPELQHYWPLIKQCDVAQSHNDFNQVGAVAYLTIHESAVQPSHSQRRGGLHTESPGTLPLMEISKAARAAATSTATKAEAAAGAGAGAAVVAGAGMNSVEKSPHKLTHSTSSGSSSSSSRSEAAASKQLASLQLQRVGAGKHCRKLKKEGFWGRGVWCNYPIGGLYMASNVGSSCQLWDASLSDPVAVVGHLGDLEHLRPALGEKGKYRPRANELIWLTDLTPHESLPSTEWTTGEKEVKKQTEEKAPSASALPKPVGARYRQYFRLVTKEISVWYARHSTPNPRGTRPPLNVLIIDTDKFEGHQAAE
jgi:hypothetical protein